METYLENLKDVQEDDSLLSKAESKIAFNLVHKIFHLYLALSVKANPFLQIRGRAFAREISPKLMHAILEFRTCVYRKSNTNLLSSFQEALEKSNLIDERSYHLVAYEKQAMKASMRLTPFPFELAYLESNVNLALNSYKNYLEVSRLLSLESKRNSIRSLFFQAGLDALKMGYEGFVALCRPERVALLESFGLRVVKENIKIKSRPDSRYYIMAADFQQISDACLDFYKKRKFF